jgi:hypothetical protein
MGHTKKIFKKIMSAYPILGNSMCRMGHTKKNIFIKARFLDIIEKNCQKLLFLVLFRALMKEKYDFLHLKKTAFC